MKRILVLVMLLVSTQGYAENSKIEVRGTVDDGENIISASGLITKYFASGVVQQQYVSLDSNTFTTITIPTGAKAVLIDMMSTDGVALKGVTGDVGISLDNHAPILLPLSNDSTTMTMGILSREGNGNKIKVYFY